ncbi:NDP-sugar synthase [Myxococcota bacterium]|nr:NDP-sugar synthase [Myxococcota bacterium]
MAPPMTSLPPDPAPLRALVLAAGLGTRLRPLTGVLPKAAVPVLGRPLAAYALVRLYAQGIREVAVNAHHLADRLETALDAWTGRRLQDLRLHYSVEAPAILGTGGGLVKARRHLRGGPFVVWNADVLTDVELAAAWGAHRERGSKVTMVLVEREDVDRYGAVAADAEGRVVDLAGIAQRPGAPARRGVFTGIQIAGPELLDALPAAGESCVVRQGLARLLREGEGVHAVFHPGRWTDLGTPQRYLDANLDLLRGDFPLPTAAAEGEDPVERGLRALFLDCAYAVDARGVEYGSPHAVEGLDGAVLEPPFAFGPACRLAPGARIGPFAVLGAKATVGAGARVRHALTWSFVELGPGERLERSVAWVEGGERRSIAVDPN